MNTGLFYDTETTGLPLFSERSSHPGQPHLVQLAARLINLDTREDINSLNFLIATEGWGISPKSTEIHGIIQEYADDYGVKEVDAVNMFFSFAVKANVRVAHNEMFDARMIRIALTRYMSDSSSDDWKEGYSECTMKLASPIVKAPATDKMKAVGRHGHKNCTISEAYKHFTGNELVNAHDAMADVNACVDVYFAIKDLS